MTGETWDPSLTMTQAQFGELCGLSQQAVSLLQARGVLLPGQSGGDWLHAYCGNLRDAAAQRSTDGPLSSQRTRLASAQAERIETANAAARKQLAPVELLGEVLAYVTAELTTRLDSLVPRLRARCPDLPAEAMRLVEREVSSMQSIAAHASLNDVESCAQLPEITFEGRT